MDAFVWKQSHLGAKLRRERSYANFDLGGQLLLGRGYAPVFPVRLACKHARREAPREEIRILIDCCDGLVDCRHGVADDLLLLKCPAQIDRSEVRQICSPAAAATRCEPACRQPRRRAACQCCHQRGHANLPFSNSQSVCSQLEFGLGDGVHAEDRRRPVAVCSTLISARLRFFRPRRLELVANDEIEEMPGQFPTLWRRAYLASARRGLHLNHRVVPAASPPPGDSPPPLVLVHGLFGSASNFGSLSRRLSKHRSVVLPDLRNHGSSFWDEDCSIEAMAGDLLRLLDTVEAERAVLCGHSLGGKVAMAAALLAPSRVAQLLVVDIAPVAYNSSNKLWQANFTIIDAMHAMPEEVMGNRKTADAALRDAGVPDAGVRAFLLQNLQPEQQSWRCNLRSLRDASYRGDVAGFPDHLPPAPTTLPTRFIAGRKSPYIMREYEPAMRHFFPGAEECGPHVVEAGHWLHAECPDEFVRLVDDFLHVGE